MALGSMGFLPAATMMAPEVGCAIDFLGFNTFSRRRSKDWMVEFIFACDVLKLGKIDIRAGILIVVVLVGIVFVAGVGTIFEYMSSRSTAVTGDIW